MPFLPVLVAVSFAVGVAVGASWLPDLWVAAAGAVVAWAVMLWRWRSSTGTGLVPVALAALVLSGVVLGAVAMRRALSPGLVRVLDTHGILNPGGARGTVALRLSGRLTADAAPANRVVLLRVAVNRVWLGACGCAEWVEDGQVLASIAGRGAVEAMGEWRAGRTVELTATLRRPLSYRNFGAPDAAVELVRRRAVLLASVKSAHLVRVVARGRWWSEAAAAVRAHARRAIGRAAGAGGEPAAIATAVLIGDRAGLDVALEERLQRAGTFHVIAISGGNIALWSMASLWIAGRLTRRRPIALAVTALALIAYAGIVGGGASVLRATGMALVGIATQWLDQRGAAVNVLSLTATVLVALDPIVVFDVGFWLTTAATAGLVLGMAAAGRSHSPWAAWTRMLVVTSIWAEAALLPIVAAVFQQVTLAGVALSALAIPAMAVVQLAALGACVADALAPLLLEPCGWLVRAASAIVTRSAFLVDVVPWVSWRVPPPSAWAFGLYYAALGAWLWSRRATADTMHALAVRRASAVVAPAAAIWVAVSPTTLVANAPRDLQVTVIDVGQGDAVLVQFPNGRRMLVDAGGASAGGRDVGARVVGPALRARGIRRLDYVLVTHADLDHIGGAATIVREFEPSEVWASIPVADHTPTARLHTAAREVGAAWRTIVRGARLDIDDVTIEAVHPPPPDWERQQVRNDDSVVLVLRYGRVRVLLTGDIGAAVEPEVGQVLAAGEPGGLTVLKVAHHGSAGATTDAWLEATRPAIAIVSAGAANPFGHPSPQVLSRLDAVAADVWRTDREGEVTVRTNGAVAEVTSYEGRRRWFTPRAP